MINHQKHISVAVYIQEFTFNYYICAHQPFHSIGIWPVYSQQPVESTFINQYYLQTCGHLWVQWRSVQVMPLQKDWLLPGNLCNRCLAIANLVNTSRWALLLLLFLYHFNLFNEISIFVLCVLSQYCHVKYHKTILYFIYWFFTTIIIYNIVKNMYMCANLIVQLLIA